MELQIHNKLGTFEVIGNFTSIHTQKVKDHFNYLLDHYEEVVISLNKVKQIDKKALSVLNDIYLKANKRSKVLFVIGKENKTIASAFEKNRLTHIFRNDY